jgi:hypothetical protein
VALMHGISGNSSAGTVFDSEIGEIGEIGDSA